MIVFKKVKSKRVNGFEALDDDDAHETPAQNSEEKNLRSDLKRKTEHDDITVPIAQYESDHTIFGSGIDNAPIIDDSTVIPKKKKNTDVSRDVKLMFHLKCVM